MVLLDMHNIPFHPLFDHFAIALLITSGLFTIVALFYKKELMLHMAFGTLIIGVLGTIGAFLTGEASAEKLIMNKSIYNILEVHETFGYIILIVSIVLFLWFVFRKIKFTKTEHIIISLIFVIMVGVLAYQNFLGADMVYGHGAAVIPVQNQLKNSSNYFMDDESNEKAESPEEERKEEEALYKNKLEDKDSLNYSLSERVADKYGINNFSKIKEISYTFNVKFNNKVFKRSWKWNPKTDEVTFHGKGDNGQEITLTYNRRKKMDKRTKKIDAGFINDNYWLLFPFHLVWDNHVDIKDAGMKDYPIGKGNGNCLIVKYTGNYGYTPGDIFELYLNKDNSIRDWIYRPGGSKTKKRPATWEGNKNFGGITISTIHNGPNKKFKLWFTDIKVTE